MILEHRLNAQQRANARRIKANQIRRRPTREPWQPIDTATAWLCALGALALWLIGATL